MPCLSKSGCALLMFWSAWRIPSDCRGRAASNASRPRLPGLPPCLERCLPAAESANLFHACPAWARARRARVAGGGC
eukprot:6079568-Pyramimonas_sp.AAC.1